MPKKIGRYNVDIWVTNNICYIAKGHPEEMSTGYRFGVGPYRCCRDGNPRALSILLWSYLILSDTHNLIQRTSPHRYWFKMHQVSFKKCSKSCYSNGYVSYERFWVSSAYVTTLRSCGGWVIAWVPTRVPMIAALTSNFQKKWRQKPRFCLSPSGSQTNWTFVRRQLFPNKKWPATVDGRNPASVDMVNIPLFTGFHASRVVQDFFHQ